MGHELVPQPQRQRVASRPTTVYAEPPPREASQQQQQQPPGQQQQQQQSGYGGGAAYTGYRTASPPQPQEFASWQVALFFGCAFIVLLLVLAIFFPVPTPWQYTLFKVTLALAGAGVGGALPGVLNFKNGWLRIGGALLFFLIIYLVNPAGYIIHWVRPEVVILDDKNRDGEYEVEGGRYTQNKGGGAEYENEGEALRLALAGAGVRTGVYACVGTQKPYPAIQYSREYAVPLVSEDDASVISDIDPRLVVVYESTLLHYGREKVLKALAPLSAKILVVAPEHPSSAYGAYGATGVGPQAPLSDEAIDERLKGRVERFVAKGEHIYKNVGEFRAKVRELLDKDRQALGR